MKFLNKHGFINWKSQSNFIRSRLPGYADGNWTKGSANEMTKKINFSNIFATHLKLTAIFDAIVRKYKKKQLPIKITYCTDK